MLTWTATLLGILLLSYLSDLSIQGIFKSWHRYSLIMLHMCLTSEMFLSDPCAHGVRSLGSNVTPYKTFLKPCEDLVKTVNVVNFVKIKLMKTS